MELKVWVEGIQRIVCGVTEKTTCQDVVYALAHATGKTGRFTLIERWRNNERLLAPQEHPLKVLQKWGEYASDVQFILQRSALDGKQNPQAGQRAATGGAPPAVWKPPPIANGAPNKFGVPNGERLSPDSGRGSDRTGSDTSAGETAAQQRKYVKPSQQMNGLPYPRYSSTGNMYGYNRMSRQPASAQSLPPYRPPPPHPQRNSSPADPPPYREPPPPPGAHRFRMPPTPTSPTSAEPVRPPHYSPPPTHRTTHLSRHPSKSSLTGRGGVPNYQGAKYQLQYTQPGRGNRQNFRQQDPNTNLADLITLVSAQQNRLHTQQSELSKYDSDLTYLEGTPPPSSSVVGGSGDQLDLVLTEVRRLEEVAQRNDSELRHLGGDSTTQQRNDSKSDDELRHEVLQLKHRLAGTDQELQKTNTTLKRLGDEMRNMSIEKSRQREQELNIEVDRLQGEIKALQKSSEDGANLSQHLSKEVKEVEEQISQRKAQVEQLIKDMRDANLESLAISPPEESKQFLDGPTQKPGTSRKMLGSPRQLENAVPTSKNPHGVWV